MSLGLFFSSLYCLLLIPITVSALAQHPLPKWGANDTKGAMNLITDQTIADALSLIQMKKVFQLGVPLTKDFPRFPPRVYDVNIRNVVPLPIEGPIDVNNVDYIEDSYTTGAAGTHMDGLFHIHNRGYHYAGWKSKDIVGLDGMRSPADLSDMSPMIGRGVVLDMTKYFGKNPVPAGTPYTEQDIKKAASDQGVTIKKGNVVLFYSGWLKFAMGAEKDAERFITQEPGLGMSGAEYLASLDIMAVGADSIGVEVVPFENKSHIFPVHSQLLVKYGIYIFEMVDTTALVASLVEDNVKEFCFVSSPPRLTGVVQLLTNPLAMY